MRVGAAQERADGSTAARWAADLGRAIAADPSATGVMGGLVAAVVVSLAAVPFAGWATPAAWFAVMAALAVAEHLWRSRRGGGGAEGDSLRDLNPFTWLSNAGYAAAAFYLCYFHGSAAQTLGVTLYGVAMFQILARDYDAPRRLAANLTAPLTGVLLVQAAATVLFIQRGTPWQLITLVASPYVVYRAFRAVRHNLVRSRHQERLALAQLGESEARYRLLAERSPDVIVRYDLAGRIEYISAAARNYGSDPAELIGRTMREFLDPSEWARNDAFLDDLRHGRPLPQGDENIWRIWTPEGVPVAFEGATSPLTDDEGRVVGAVAVLRDVTARLALEDELRRKRAEAEAAAVAKSQFLANMSHEIRTPLTGVIGFAGLLAARDDLPAEAQRYVRRIHTSAGALLGVVNDVLDFSKLEANQVELDRRPLDPKAFVEETADLVRDQAGRKGLKISVAVGEGLPDWIEADGARLRQVLLNLLTNAVKFTEAGGVTVSAEREAEGARLRIAVKDTGVGVPPEVAGRLFQRFSQVDGSSTRQHGGSGLGLAISKALIDLMGGEIGMESEPGRGSTFWFTIPAEATAPAAERPSAAAQGAELGVGTVRILMVDDVAVNRELVAAMLQPFDVRMVEADSGAAAIRAARRTGFDLILMDLQMPGMDGLAAAAEIRAACELNRATPILALSANILPEQVEACLAAGMDDHIGKPIDPAELLDKIARWTARREAA